MTTAKNSWRCPSCGKVYSIAAHKPDPAICSECRSAQTQPLTGDGYRPQVTKDASPLFAPITSALAVIVIVVLAFGWLYLLEGFFSSGMAATPTRTPTTSSKVVDPNDKTIEAWTMAETFVAKLLKSPSTASFGSVFGEYQDPRECVRSLGKGIYQVTGWVDSQNGFGATVRTHFIVNVKDKGDAAGTWSMIGKPTMVQR